ncbi:MAG: nucleotidyltransferase substrate binding protein [Flavobacterium sp.]|nr:nucleotidyltransferase substrate binding protein [Flavobacterium sp.]
MDIRWEQRFSNFIKAIDKLQQSVNYINENIEDDNEDDFDSILDEMIKEGLIQRFEYTHELAWNVMKDYAEYQGNSLIGGSRDAVREALQLQIISDGEIWMDMIKSRNKTFHTYNEETANEIYVKILNEYYPAFRNFKTTMEEKRSRQEDEIL